MLSARAAVSDQNISFSEVRDLKGVLDREKADIGAYISFAEPTSPMKREAAEAGFYTSFDGTKYPRLQLVTIKGLLEGTQHLQRPLHVRDITFKPAPKHRSGKAENLSLTLGDLQETVLGQQPSDAAPQRAHRVPQ